MRKHNQHFKLLFFTINWHLVTSDQVSTYRKLNLPLRNIICLVSSRLSPGNAKKIQADQSYYTRYFFWKKTTHKLLKVEAAKTLFFSVHVIDMTCFNELFLFQVITGRHYFSSWSLIWDCFYCHIVAFLEASVLNESVFYVLSPQQ